VKTAAASLADRWRAEAAVLRQRGAVLQAECLETCACDMETILTQTELESLTVADAARESGFSASQLRRLVRAGVLPHAEDSGVTRVRRGDLPRKIRPVADAPPSRERGVLTLAGRTP
jgi:hypothetical protein